MKAQAQNMQLSQQEFVLQENLPQTINVPSTHASLYVGDLNEDVTEAMLYDKFNRIGTIISIRVCRDIISRKSLGYAYVNFSMTSEAEKAIDELNFDTLKGRQMRIMWSQRDPSLRKSGVGNLFIKNLDKSIQIRDIYDTFSTIGDILSCKIPVDDKGQSKGYGFVHFLSKEAAETAVKKLNGSILSNKKIFVGHFIPRNERNVREDSDSIFNNLYVKNFGETMTQVILQDMFKEFGEITSLFVPLNDKGVSKGFGFVCFKDSKSAVDAIKSKNQTDFEGRTIYVGRAMKKTERMEFLRSVHEKKKIVKSSRYPNGVNLYVKNLEDSIDEEKLRTEFSQYGNITSIKIMTDAQNRSKGFGFVCFTYPDEATKAVTEMNGKLICGKPLYVALAQRKEERKVHLQNQMVQRQLAYHSFPPNAAQPFNLPSSMIAGVQGTTSPFVTGTQLSGQQQFQNTAGQLFVYPGYANQPQGQQPLAMTPGLVSQVIGNRMVNARPLRWAQQHVVQPGQIFRTAYPGYPGGLIRSQPLGGGGVMPAHITNRPGMMQQHVPTSTLLPNTVARVQSQQSNISNQLTGTSDRDHQMMLQQQQHQQNQIQYVANARNIGAANMNSSSTAPPDSNVGLSQSRANGTSLNTFPQQTEVEGSIEEFLNHYKSCKDQDKTQLLGEKLYGIIDSWYPAQVGKLTGMLLEIENSELMAMIVESMSSSAERTMLRRKVDAAMQVLTAQPNIVAGATGFTVANKA